MEEKLAHSSRKAIPRDTRTSDTTRLPAPPRFPSPETQPSASATASSPILIPCNNSYPLQRGPRTFLRTCEPALHRFQRSRSNAIHSTTVPPQPIRISVAILSNFCACEGHVNDLRRVFHQRRNFRLCVVQHDLRAPSGFAHARVQGLHHPDSGFGGLLHFAETARSFMSSCTSKRWAAAKENLHRLFAYTNPTLSATSAKNQVPPNKSSGLPIFRRNASRPASTAADSDCPLLRRNVVATARSIHIGPLAHSFAFFCANFPSIIPRASPVVTRIFVAGLRANHSHHAPPTPSPTRK